MSVTIEIEGLERLQGKLQTLESGRYLKSVLQAAALDIKGYMAWYPPSTAANSPFARRWYERGYGPRWYRKDGSINGYQTSEMLDRKWAAARPRVSAKKLEAKVGVKVSYAPYVQSEEKQAWFHRARGWRTDEDAVEQRGPHVIRLVQRAVRRILEHEQTMAWVDVAQGFLKGVR
jgi:hypothetical protein